MTVYRNSLFFRCKNIFVRFTQIFTMKIFPMMARQRPHTSTSLVAAASISLYSWQPLTQQAIYFSPAISLARGAISSINAHHTRLAKLFSVQKLFYLRIFFDEILLQTKKKRITVFRTIHLQATEEQVKLMQDQSEIESKCGVKVVGLSLFHTVLEVGF